MRSQLIFSNISPTLSAFAQKRARLPYGVDLNVSKASPPGLISAASQMYPLPSSATFFGFVNTISNSTLRYELWVWLFKEVFHFCVTNFDVFLAYCSWWGTLPKSRIPYKTLWGEFTMKELHDELCGDGSFGRIPTTP